jgi:hypothetical protein
MKKKVQNKIDAIVNRVKLDLIYSDVGNQPASAFMRGLRRVQRRAIEGDNLSKREEENAVFINRRRVQGIS